VAAAADGGVQNIRKVTQDQVYFITYLILEIFSFRSGMSLWNYVQGECEIHSEALMNQNFPHAGDLLQRDLRMIPLEIRFLTASPGGGAAARGDGGEVMGAESILSYALGTAQK